uniref:Uncharacterized protein n=1 Tax=Romanomermis culicivorax TaxID=13658 RepID=A0A915L2A9_ROMCU
MKIYKILFAMSATHPPKKIVQNPPPRNTELSNSPSATTYIMNELVGHSAI